MSGSSDLTGLWSGEFAYPHHAGPTTPFLARLEDHAGQLSGTIIEPNIWTGAGTAEATIIGLRHGTSVDFTKSYGPPAPEGYESPVDYVGTVTPDGNTVKGVWSLLDMDGTFEMRREEETREEQEAETEAALPLEPLVQSV